MSYDMINNEDEKINLVDLFIFFIKYRIIFILSLLLTISLLVFGYFYIPSYKYNNSKPTKSLKVACKVVTGPAMELIDSDLNIAILFNSMPSYYDAFVETGYDKVGGIDINNPSNKAIIIDWLERNNIVKVTDDYILSILPNQNHRFSNIGFQSISLEMQTDNPEKSIVFLNILFEIINNKIKDVIQNQSNYPDSGNVEISNKKMKMDALIMFDEPYVIEHIERVSIDKLNSQYIKRSVVILLLVLFLSIFTALFHQYITNIKNDVKSMEKIRSATKKESK